MSELKEWTASEIEEYDDARLELAEDGKIDCTRVYLKSEADEVIAEIKERHKEEVDELQKATDSAWSKVNAMYDEIRHQKYKRCMAMAKWCEAVSLWCYQAANTLPAGFHATLYGKPVMIEPDRLFRRCALLKRWYMRWLKLAKEFKRGYENGRR